MKVAQVVWPDNAMPPSGYGPLQLVASNLANELDARGYDVTSFVAGGSKVHGKRVKIAPMPIREDRTVPDPLYYHSVLLAELVARRNDFDVIHSHIGHAIISVLDILDTPVIITSHGSYDNPHPRSIYKKYAQKAHFVAISESQKKSLPGVNYAGVVYHGIDMKDFGYSDDPGNYMMYVGRTSPSKGLGPSIQCSLKTGFKLVIAAHSDETDAGKKYFSKEIEPYIHSASIDFRGEMQRAAIIKTLRKAKCLLFPIEWEEPFGLVVAEANACGTPVVAYARGAMPELIKDGINGYLVKPGDLRGFVAAVKKLYEMPEAEYQAMRRRCRAHVEQNFTIQKMVDGYEKVYAKVLAEHKGIKA